MMRASLLLVLSISIGCGGSHGRRGGTDAGSGSDAGGGTDAGGGSDAGPGAIAGDCETDLECMPDGTCMELEPGIRMCFTTPVEVTECSTSFDECCDSTECADGACFVGPVVPSCGGPGMVEHNVCASDQCTADTDCGDGLRCLPAGAFGRPVRTCMAASCASDADCTDAALGRCVIFRDSCCALPQLACQYPGACRTDSDCTDGHCVVRDGATACDPGPPACPG